MSQPPYGAPPPPGQPQQGYPPAPPPAYPPAPPQGYPAAPQPGVAQPPAYLQAGAPVGGPAPVGYAARPGLPPPPPNKKRTIGLLMGFLTAFALLGFAGLVLLISLID
ncbi:hypothetical protein F0U44_05295 [Nocardioides humilatus]|uniref:Uncharacterized protein n=1 Tax=Nocardioides humilatus TaxID=2607660 RepID=A0A5B1LLT6_9ACTN|nr:hypothetical protein [Nocardioides humilatus]KAA1421691.1 hypothetical protein F0U44_05295 [Nocardioides humilatus]